jgi:hypothetical protein
MGRAGRTETDLRREGSVNADLWQGDLWDDPDSTVRQVRECSPKLATSLVVKHHYLHRKPPITHSFVLVSNGLPTGAITFGTPPSRHLQLGACPDNPGIVLELNRLWVSDDEPRNTETWFMSRALRMLPSRIIVSYADTTHGHAGYVYRAANWHYAGWTDMDRRTPRYDYVATSGGHSRDAFRSGFTQRVRRLPKVKYWTTTGTKPERKALAALMRWPIYSWHEMPPPGGSEA